MGLKVRENSVRKMFDMPLTLVAAGLLLWQSQGRAWLLPWPG